MLRYFAYGSNMLLPRICARVESVRPIGPATLTGHRLLFHKVGQDGSAKCDAFYTGSGNDCIYGVLYEIPCSKKPLLDRAEGLGKGYDTKQVKVILKNGIVHDAYLYIATLIDESLKPFSWYKELVLHGALSNNLPKSYVSERIEKVEAMDDPDKTRSMKNLRLLSEFHQFPQALKLHS